MFTPFQRFALTVILVGCFALQVNVSGESPPTRTGSQESNVAEKRFRLREGAKLVEQVGDFKETGGRIAFYPDGTSASLQVLENLALERVAQNLAERSRKWSVTGLVTEYRGGNYLLLHRAVQKARDGSEAAPR